MEAKKMTNQERILGKTDCTESRIILNELFCMYD
ncbi:MAG: hypothetical protein BWY55_00447 [archaeon ADurb.Bin336]|nr:MAG: hypothetical protein BWY55_00447 [archaeon ADurb.Bin336]